MLKEDQEWVVQVIKEEIAKISITKNNKPVEVDIEGIVERVTNTVLDKIKSIPVVTTDIPIVPKKGKEKINV